MAMISKSCEYGLRATLYVAAQKEREFVPIHEISDALDISFHFLTKILQKLTRGGILNSYRGPSGGVSLAKPAKSVSLLQIINAIEDREIFSSCILGLAGCGERTPCPMHKFWAGERSRIEAAFRQSTLDKLAGQIARGEIRLAD